MSVRFKQVRTPRLADVDAETVRREHERAIEELRRVIREIEARVGALE